MLASGSHRYAWRDPRRRDSAQDERHYEGQQHPGDDAFPQRNRLVLLLGVVQPSVYVPAVVSHGAGPIVWYQSNEVVVESGSQFKAGANLRGSLPRHGSRNQPASGMRLIPEMTQLRRLSLLALSVMLTAIACSGGSGSGPPEPPPMSVLGENGEVLAEAEAGSWCRDGLITDSCAAVDRPVPEVIVACETDIAVALPESFAPEPGALLGERSSTDGSVWPVTKREGGILVRAEGSGDWSRASWSFDLIREGC